MVKYGVVIQLYKTTAEGIRYWQGWDEESVIVIHWGILGTQGEVKEIAKKASYSATEFLRKASQRPRDAGYQSIVTADREDFVLLYPTDERKSMRQQGIKRARIEAIVEKALGWTGNGSTDGYDFKRGNTRIFCKVINSQIAAGSIIPELRAENLANGLICGQRQSAKSMISIWPTSGEKTSI